MLAVSTHSSDCSVVCSAYSAVERLCIDSYMSERLGAADALAHAVLVLSQDSTAEDPVPWGYFNPELSQLNQHFYPRYKLGLISTRNCHNLTSIFTPGINWV
jgi:hypothetical protein